MVKLKQAALIGGIVAVIAIVLWLGFSYSGTSQDGASGSSSSAAKWSGRMQVSTEEVQITYDGRMVQCTANGQVTPGHFILRVTNYAEQPLACNVQVREDEMDGYQPANDGWFEVGGIPEVPPQKTETVMVRVLLPKGLPNGKYAITVVVSKNEQSATVPVYINVLHKVTT